MIVGRRMRIHRLSMCRRSSSPATGASGRFFVGDRVVDAEDFAVDANGPRNPNLVAKAGGNSLGDAAFPVARRAEQKQSSAGIDGRAEAFEDAVAQ